MKIRLDFVTNSSSSSFICSFKNREDFIKTINQLESSGVGFDSKIAADMKSGIVQFSQIKEMLLGWYKMMYSFNMNNYRKLQQDAKSGGRRGHDIKRELSNRWVPKVGRANTYDEYRNRLLVKDGKETFDQYAKRQLIYAFGKDYASMINNSESVFAVVEYSDNQRDYGTNLEHGIMPAKPFVAEIISNY